MQYSTEQVLHVVCYINYDQRVLDSLLAVLLYLTVLLIKKLQLVVQMFY